MVNFELQINNVRNQDFNHDYHLLKFLFQVLIFLVFCIWSFFQLLLALIRRSYQLLKNSILSNSRKIKENETQLKNNQSVSRKIASNETINKVKCTYNTYKKIAIFKNLALAKEKLKNPIDNSIYKYA